MVKAKDLSKVLKEIIKELDKHPEAGIHLMTSLNSNEEWELLDLNAAFNKTLNCVTIDVY